MYLKPACVDSQGQHSSTYVFLCLCACLLVCQCVCVLVCLCVCLFVGLFVSVFELTRADTYTEITYVYYLVYTTGVQVCYGCCRQQPSLATGRVGCPWAYVYRQVCQGLCLYCRSGEWVCANGHSFVSANTRMSVLWNPRYCIPDKRGVTRKWEPLFSLFHCLRTVVTVLCVR